MRGFAFAVGVALAASSTGATMQEPPSRIERIAGPPGLPFSALVKADGLLHVAGTMATDTVERPVEGDIRVQTRRTLESIGALLRRHGSGLDRVLSVNVYLTRAEDFAAMNEVYTTFFPKDPPARTTVVAALVLPGALVEMSAVAVPNGSPREVVHPAAWATSPNPYSYGVRAGDTLMLAGLVARDVKANAPVEGDMAAQTKLVLENAGEVLRAAGMSYADVVSSRVYITDGAAFQEMNAAYRPFFPGDKPVRATVVTGLMLPAYKVEITLVAVKGAKQAFVAPGPDGSPGQPSPNFSHALRAGTRLFVAGMLGDTPVTRGDAKAQAAEALARIARTMRAAGYQPADAVDAVVYVTDARHFAAMNEAWREVFGTQFPARATVVTDLVAPDGLVEIMITAARP